MSRTLAKWLILIALSAYAVLVTAWAASVVHERVCTGIEIDIKPASAGVPSVLRQQSVLSELGDLPSKYSRIPLYSINTDSLERHLNSVNNFEHVEVVRTSQGKLLISVVPLIPEARIFTPAESYYINKDGKRMDANADFYVDLPIVRGNFTNRMPAKDVLTVVQYIKQDKVLSELITMIDYRSPTNILLVPRIRGHVINLGDTSRLADKFGNLMLMYRKVMPYKGWNTYDTISLKYKGQIIATRADKSIRKHNNINADDIIDYEEEALADQLHTDEATTPIDSPPATSTDNSTSSQSSTSKTEKTTKNN
ncbi:MAG: hypothetical protein NC217_00725 [Muribaculaceae bacterium]|nr:hypothetical protein [Muribaculaceae bacterium]